MRRLSGINAGIASGGARKETLKVYIWYCVYACQMASNVTPSKNPPYLDVRESPLDFTWKRGSPNGGEPNKSIFLWKTSEETAEAEKRSYKSCYNYVPLLKIVVLWLRSSQGKRQSASEGKSSGFIIIFLTTLELNLCSDKRLFVLTASLLLCFYLNGLDPFTSVKTHQV